MRSLSLLALLFAATPADGHAQVRRSVFQIHVIGATGSPEYGGAGLGFFRRSTGRLVYGLTTSSGVSGSFLTLRTEALLLFQLDPGRRSGVAPYGGGGVVWRVVDGDHAGFLLMLVGVEASPRAASGWFLEMGVGAGLRGAIGWRIRR